MKYFTVWYREENSDCNQRQVKARDQFDAETIVHLQLEKELGPGANFEILSTVASWVA